MGKSFILVDDDRIANLINRKFIERTFDGSEIHTFLSAYEALQFLLNLEDYQNQNFTLFLDINMPGMNGWDFLEEIEREFSFQNIRIIILSSSVDPADIKRAQDYKKVQSYILKPLNVEKIKKLNL